MNALNDGWRRVALTVEPPAAGTRLDAWLAGAADLSRTRAKALILEGHVTIGGATIVEPRRPVKPGEPVTLDMPPPEPAEPAGETIPFDIVYEDADLIVIDKPAWLVVHPAAGNRTGTLVNALIAHCGASLSGIGGVMRPGIVHRLDKDTTGLMVVAKTDKAHAALAAQFADHGRSGPLERGYLALVWGVPEPAEGTIEAALARSPRNRERMAVTQTGGRVAITHYAVRERYGRPGKPPLASLVECQLETGRTHQVRVHMAAIGHPLIGDRLYGAGFATKVATLPEPAQSIAAGLTRQALHAWLLVFEHPTSGATMRFERPLPPDLKSLRDALARL